MGVALPHHGDITAPPKNTVEVKEDQEQSKPKWTGCGGRESSGCVEDPAFQRALQGDSHDQLWEERHLSNSAVSMGHSLNGVRKAPVLAQACSQRRQPCGRERRHIHGGTPGNRVVL